jgi:hypothetical protein
VRDNRELQCIADAQFVLGFGIVLSVVSGRASTMPLEALGLQRGIFVCGKSRTGNPVEDIDGPGGRTVDESFREIASSGSDKKSTTLLRGMNRWISPDGVSETEQFLTESATTL